MEPPPTQIREWAEQSAFRATLAENIGVVQDSLRAIRDELNDRGERWPAQFFGRLALVLELFLRSWESGQPNCTASSLTRLCRRRFWS